jgi:DNA-binding NtrC family response regulator
MELPAPEAGKPARLLLIDDEPVLLRCYSRLLAQKYEVDTAGNAADALRLLLQNEPYDIVLSDLQMPIQDGLGLLRSVRALQPSSIRLLFTGGVDRRISAALGDGTVFTVIEKPCPAELLFDTLNDCMEIYPLPNAV